MDRERIDRFLAAKTAGEVARGAWVAKDENGQEIVCPLLLFAPECRDDDCGFASRCPADQLWPWFSELVPWITDRGSAAKAASVLDRLGDLAERLDELTAQDGAELDYGVRAIAVREAMRHTVDNVVLAVCERTALLCERAGRGEDVSRNEWDTAAALSALSARDASNATSNARAAQGAWEATQAARYAARYAASAASDAAKGVKGIWEVAMYAWPVEDRIIDAIFSAFEARCALREAAKQ